MTAARDGNVATLHDVGFNDGQIVEIMAHIAPNLFTNYVNAIFDVPAAFPKMALSK